MTCASACTTGFAASAFGIAPNNTVAVARCAAAFGDKYSLASGVQALGNLVGVNANNGVVVNGLLGNDVSTLSNLAFGSNPGAAARGVAISNPSDYNAVSLGVRMLANPLAATTVTLGYTANGAAYGAEVVTPTIAQSVLGASVGSLLSSFTVGKLALDAATYTAGLFVCSQTVP